VFNIFARRAVLNRSITRIGSVPRRGSQLNKWRSRSYSPLQQIGHFLFLLQVNDGRIFYCWNGNIVRRLRVAAAGPGRLRIVGQQRVAEEGTRVVGGARVAAGLDVEIPFEETFPQIRLGQLVLGLPSLGLPLGIACTHRWRLDRPPSSSSWEASASYNISLK
jgi:hypothetical protein